MPDELPLPDDAMPPLSDEQKRTGGGWIGSPVGNMPVAPADVPALDPTDAIVGAVTEGASAAADAAGAAAEAVGSVASAAGEAAGVAAGAAGEAASGCLTAGLGDGCSGCGCSAVVAIGMLLTAGAAVAAGLFR